MRLCVRSSGLWLFIGDFVMLALLMGSIIALCHVMAIVAELP
jgi:hypothetical protein